MSRSQLEALLQECLTAYDQGLAPQDCLAAFPEHRAELEPLLRQALALRIAFAEAPAEALKQRLRERLLFAAGSEAIQSYAAEPDPEFVANTRGRFLETAGASAQEALRAVPPPRLTFWTNARRRLLEAGSLARPRRTAPLALQRSLSVAVIVLAITVAGLAYVTSGSSPGSVSAEFASLEYDLTQIEQRAAAGETVSPSVIVALTMRTNDLLEKLDDQSAAAVAQRLPEIIERQREVVSFAVSEGAPLAQLRQAQQEMAEAEAKVRTLTAIVEPSIPSFPETLIQDSPTPTPTAPATITATPEPPEGAQVRISLYPSDTTFNISWTEIRTTNIRLLVPSDWQIIGVTTTNNIATLETIFLRVDGPEVIVMIDTNSGGLVGLINSEPVTLRSEGPNGAALDIEALIAIATDQAPALHHIIGSLAFND